MGWLRVEMINGLTMSLFKRVSTTGTQRHWTREWLSTPNLPNPGIKRVSRSCHSTRLQEQHPAPSACLKRLPRARSRKPPAVSQTIRDKGLCNADAIHMCRLENEMDAPFRDTEMGFPLRLHFPGGIRGVSENGHNKPDLFHNHTAMFPIRQFCSTVQQV